MVGDLEWDVPLQNLGCNNMPDLQNRGVCFQKRGNTTYNNRTCGTLHPLFCVWVVSPLHSGVRGPAAARRVSTQARQRQRALRHVVS